MISTRILMFAAAAAVLSAAPAVAGQPAPAAPATAAPAVEAEAPPAPVVLNAGAAGFTRINPSPAADIVTELKAAGQYGAFLKAAEAVNLTALLGAAGRQLTVFAPTDAAFAALPAGRLDELMKPDNAAQLQQLIAYHVVATKVTADQVKGKKGPVSTAIGKQVEVDGSADHIKVGDAYVLQNEVAATNGVIYPVDKVLTPPA